MISLSLSLSLSRIRFSFLRLRRNSCQVINIPLLMLLRSRPYFMWFEDVPVPNDPSVFLASQRPGTFYFRLSTVRLHATRHPLSPGSALSLFEPLTSDCDLLLRYSWTHESWCCTTWERPRMPTSAILSTAVVPSFAPSRFRIFAVACCDTAALPTRRSMHCSRRTLTRYRLLSTARFTPGTLLVKEARWH
mgnify:CR=1 FL=1